MDLMQTPVMSHYEKPAADWSEAQLRLRHELHKWVYESMQHQAGVLFRGIHDEVTWLNAFMGDYLISGDEAVLRFLKRTDHDLAQWIKRHGYHGYYPNDDSNPPDPYSGVAHPQNAHHGIENFARLSGHLYQLDSGSAASIATLVDVAHHLGNWVPGVPPWYDFNVHQYTGSPGTRAVIPMGNQRFQMFGWDLLAFHAYGATNDNKYLDFALDHLLHQTPAATDPVLGEVDMQLVFGGMIPALLDAAFLTGDTTLTKLAQAHVKRLCSGPIWEEFYADRPLSFIPQRILIPLLVYRKLLGGWPRTPWQPIPAPRWGKPPNRIVIRLDQGCLSEWFYQPKDGPAEPRNWSSALIQLAASEMTDGGDPDGLRAACEEANYRFRHAALMCVEGRYQGCRVAGSGALAFIEVAPMLFGPILGLPELYPLHDAVFMPEVLFYRAGGALGLDDECAARLYHDLSLGKRVVHLVNRGKERCEIRVRLHPAIAELSRMHTLRVDAGAEIHFPFTPMARERAGLPAGALHLTQGWNQLPRSH